MELHQPLLVKVINIILSIVQIILGLHIVLKLFGAATVPFVRFVYQLSHPLMRPFAGIFKSVQLNGHYALDLSALFALVVYSALGYILIKLAAMISAGRK